MHPWHLHELIPNYEDNGWKCDGSAMPGGCKRGITDFNQTAGMRSLKSLLTVLQVLLVSGVAVVVTMTCVIAAGRSNCVSLLFSDFADREQSEGYV